MENKHVSEGWQYYDSTTGMCFMMLEQLDGCFSPRGRSAMPDDWSGEFS
jgi:hypothetical protein